MAADIGLFLLSAATLTFEITLTRVFSVTQFYHFAFMIVSLSLLGYAVSGTVLTVFPSLREIPSRRLLIWLGVGFSLSVTGSYTFTVYVPFDSFRIAHDWRQGVVFAAHYLALSLPFLCCGLAVAHLFAAHPEYIGRTYGVNLSGSAVGCLVAVSAPNMLGGEGTVLLAAGLGLLAAAIVHQLSSPPHVKPPGRGNGWVGTQAVLWLGFLALAFGAVRTPAVFSVRLSPYKSLSHALLAPGAQVIFQRWNSFSRVDVVRSTAIRSLPGSGFRCSATPPQQLGLTVDGDDLSPISHLEPGFGKLSFTDCVLLALPFRLRPQADALILEPRGGFDVVVALSEGAHHVVVVEPNPLIVAAVQAQGEWAGNLYTDPRVRIVGETGRAFVRRTDAQFDVIVLSLTSAYHPITSGAYSLAEDYRYTVEAFEDYLRRLKPDGILAVMRWLQIPPSECVRAFALAIEASERLGSNPATEIVALRSYQQMLILVRRGPFTNTELELIRSFSAARSFDLVYLPDLRPEEINRHNILREPLYEQVCTALVQTTDRTGWYRDYPFDVRPPIDDRPFFGHFFKWQQTPEVLALAGRTWQPFGGMGYLVLLGLLALAVAAATILVILPLVVRPQKPLNGDIMPHQRPWGGSLLYAAWLGLGYMLVEIPLLQQLILFLGYPVYALAIVLFTLLLFSGLGSLSCRHFPLRSILISLLLIIGAYIVGLPRILRCALGLPINMRVVVAVGLLAPLAWLMGMPFPKGLTQLERHTSLLAWAWGVNGAMSVVAPILAAALAFSWGFTIVLALGAGCYLGALITALVFLPRPARQRQ